MTINLFMFITALDRYASESDEERHTTRTSFLTAACCIAIIIQIILTVAQWLCKAVVLKWYAHRRGYSQALQGVIFKILYILKTASV